MKTSPTPRMTPLPPTDVMDADYLSATFRVLKNGELREFAEYCTQKRMLAAWDAMKTEGMS